MANVVLVHGGWSDGSSWSGVIPILQEAGHDVIAVQNPLTSLADDVANTRAVLAGLDGPTVVAGHSYGGSVISGAAGDAPDVVGLVFVCALANDEGESANDIQGRFPATDVMPLIQVDDGGFMMADRAAFPEVYAGDVDPATRGVISAVMKPTSAACLTEAGGPPAWRSLPCTYLVSEQDRMVSPDAQRWLAERIGANTISVPSSHAMHISHPREVADAILAAAG